MKTRKLILIVADVVLLAVCIVQAVLNAKDTVKTFTFTEAPDEIVIEKADGNLALVKENDKWFIGADKYSANNGSVEVLVEAASSIKALDKMGKASNEVVASRYDLIDGKKIVVSMKKEGKVLRTIVVGKESSTGTQGYVTIDGSDDVYLIASNLKNTFNKSVDDLRDRTVYQLDKNTISAVSVTDVDGETWTVSRVGDGENLSWAVAGAEADIDTKAATEWFNSLANLTTTKWLGSNDKLNGELEEIVKITAGGKVVTVTIYVVPAVDEDGKDTYYGYCSEIPYPFEIPAYTAQKFQKELDDIAK